MAGTHHQYQIKAITQNVAGTRRAEVAAQSLHELGHKLGALIGSKTV